MMRADVGAILSDLDTLQTDQAWTRKLAHTFSNYGFNSFTYVGIKPTAANDGTSKVNLGDVIVLTNANAGWVQHYAEENYQNDDPIVKECFSNRLPVRWTENFRANLRSKREDIVLTDGFEFGIRRGLAIPLHGPSGEWGIMSLYSDLADSEFTRNAEGVQFDLQVMSMYFHDAVQRSLANVAPPPIPIPLTEREVEILQWTALGKTAWEIGSIVKISERTVNFHLQNAMSKLGVHNKTHAAYKAVSVGLIHP
jgi:DNA-binding CsgD family transcriptional regulator